MSDERPVDPQGNPLTDDVVGSRPAVRDRAALASALGAEQVTASIVARELGHAPEPWSATIYTAATTCATCGAHGTVSVSPGPPITCSTGGPLFERPCVRR